MKKPALLVILLFFAVKTARADTTAHISDNGAGAKSSVNVNNSVSSTSNQSSTSQNHTSIRIETNGQVKTFESDTPGNVHLESDDGSSLVDINNNITPAPKSTFTLPPIPPTPFIDKQKIKMELERIKEKIAEQDRKNNALNRNILQEIRDFLNKLLSSLKQEKPSTS